MTNLELENYVYCDVDEIELFGKDCSIIDDTMYKDNYIIEINGIERIAYKENVNKNKIDILNHIIFLLSDYSDLFINDVEDIRDLCTIKGVEITINKSDVLNCNNFEELYNLAKRIIDVLFNEEESKEEKEEIKMKNKEIKKEILKKENDYIIYKCNNVYRVHFFSDENNIKMDKFKSFITKNKDTLIKGMLKRGYKLDDNLNTINNNSVFKIDKNVNINSNELYNYVKNTFIDGIERKNYDKSINFINKYLDLLNINDVRVYRHISVKGTLLMLKECNRLDNFKSLLDNVKIAYNKGKILIDSYINIKNDIDFFTKEGDFLEVKEIKESIKDSYKLSNNLLMY